MSTKTCQLCGKALGRRGDGDFCSSEHRNQFRLRRGMDRLEEANKVASLMRRRENPRTIPASQLAVTGACTPRASTDPCQFPSPQQEPRLRHLNPVLHQTRVLPKEERFANPLSVLSRRSGTSNNRMATPASLPFVARRAVPVLESKKSTKPAAGVVRANSTRIPSLAPGVKGEARTCGAALQVARRPVAPQRQTQPSTFTGGGLEKSRQFQTLILEATGGGDGEMKAYAAREFARRSPAVRREPRGARVQTGLPEPTLQQMAHPEKLDVAPIARACDIPRTLGIPRLPELHATVAVSGTGSGGIAPMRAVIYEPAGPAEPRICATGWEATTAMALPGLHGRAFRAGLERAGAPLALSAACNGAQENRPAKVAFAPAESPFEPAPMVLYGAFAANGDEPGRASLDVIEEHFDAGLDQWAGDIVDWKLDAAGARPAGLALFRPTQSLSNYEFEFFTRIENRAVTYAFRAVNVSNYFKITIAMVESGRYELRRCAVIGGIEEPAATAPLPGVLRPGAAFTVKTRAWQNDFTIWLDGELAARWTDGRLPAGGIGFLAPRDDRARVYWVRLSLVESPNLQAASGRRVRSIQ